ncbi:MAG: EthD family reductase [Oscillospiraceae bacterium]
MISSITLFNKRADLSTEAFEKYWSEVHAPKCMKVPSVYGYEQNYVFLKENGDASSEAVVADGFSIELYETLHEYETAVASPEYALVLSDRANFAEHTQTYVSLENISIPCREGEGFKKKITLLGRTVPHVSFEDYTREWLVVHSGCMIKMSRDIFYGYNQHIVIDRLIDGRHASYDELPTDGILELYYSDPKEVANAFATTEEGRMTVSHRKEFMSKVNAFQLTYKKFK